MMRLINVQEYNNIDDFVPAFVNFEDVTFGKVTAWDAEIKCGFLISSERFYKERDQERRGTQFKI